MSHFIAGAFARLRAGSALSIAAIALAALGAGCERPTDQISPEAPGAAVRPEAPQAGRVAEAAERLEPSCGEPSEGCDCKENMADSDAVAAIEEVRVGSSPARGPEDAPVTVVVFSDFQCPFCAKSLSTMAQLEAHYPGKLRFVFKNNPLPIHASAKLAAKAALAANEQGKFWAFHDALFARQKDEGAFDAASLEGYASDLGLDIARFRRSMSAGDLDAAIQADMAEGKRLNVRGTPTFFVNGRRVTGMQPLSAFRAVVDQELAAP